MGVGVFLFLYIEQVHNQQKKQDFMEGLKKIRSHFRSVAPNFFTAQTLLIKCAFLFSASVTALSWASVISSL